MTSGWRIVQFLFYSSFATRASQPNFSSSISMAVKEVIDQNMLLAVEETG